jgi:DNA replication protein DnaC
MAIRYVKEFDNLKNAKNNSIAFLGQVGSGKTHLSIAIANELMKKNIGVLYMQYREVIIQLKQCIMDEENYNREIDKYKNATVLLIDDLYKGKITDSDRNIMFEIINYRYLKSSPIIVSSEFTVDAIIDIDEAIGSRIVEMCKGHIFEFSGQELNYRLS